MIFVCCLAFPQNVLFWSYRPLCSSILGMLSSRSMQLILQCREAERFLSSYFLHLWIILTPVLEIRVPKSHHHPQISCGCWWSLKAWFGLLLSRFTQKWDGASPGVSRRSSPDIFLSWDLAAAPIPCPPLIRMPVAMAAPANPTTQGRLFHGCDNALRVPFESLISEPRALHRVTFLEWLQGL